MRLDAKHLDSDAQTVRKLHQLAKATHWLDWFAFEVGTNEGRKTKRWPHQNRDENELRKAVSHGEDLHDHAFFELVARDPGYLFTNAGRVRILLWHLQTRLVDQGRATDDHGASAKFTTLARALGRSSRAKPHDGRALYAEFVNAREAVLAAITAYKKGRAKPSDSTLARDHSVSPRTAARIRESSKLNADRITLLVDVEVGARRHLEPDRVAQLRRHLEENHDYLFAAPISNE